MASLMKADGTYDYDAVTTGDDAEPSTGGSNTDDSDYESETACSDEYDVHTCDCPTQRKRKYCPKQGVRKQKRKTTQYDTGDTDVENDVSVNKDSVDNSSEEHGVPLSDFKCSECEMKFSNPSARNKHMRSSHTEFHCTFENCKKVFRDPNSCRKHVMVVHKGVKRCVCKICEETFSTAGSLKHHIYCVHTENCEKTKYVCEECQKVFYTKSKLSLHKSVHTGEKNYQCRFEGCGKSFRLRSNFIKHEKLHANIKPYLCTKCGECFTRKAYLDTHMYKHTGVKEFKCDVCGKLFTTKGNLTVHMSIHKSDKPVWKCELCPRSFSFKSNFTKHFRQVHECNDKSISTDSTHVRSTKAAAEYSETAKIEKNGREKTKEKKKSVTSATPAYVTSFQEFEEVKRACRSPGKRVIYLMKSNNTDYLENRGIKLVPDLYPKSGSKKLISSDEIVTVKICSTGNSSKKYPNSVSQNMSEIVENPASVCTPIERLPVQVEKFRGNLDVGTVLKCVSATNLGSKSEDSLLSSKTEYPKSLTIKNSHFTSLLENRAEQLDIPRISKHIKVRNSTVPSSVMQCGAGDLNSKLVSMGLKLGQSLLCPKFKSVLAQQISGVNLQEIKQHSEREKSVSNISQTVSNICDLSEHSIEKAVSGDDFEQKEENVLLYDGKRVISPYHSRSDLQNHSDTWNKVELTTGGFISLHCEEDNNEVSTINRTETLELSMLNRNVGESEKASANNENNQVARISSFGNGSESVNQVPASRHTVENLETEQTQNRKAQKSRIESFETCILSEEDLKHIFGQEGTSTSHEYKHVDIDSTDLCSVKKPGNDSELFVINMETGKLSEETWKNSNTSVNKDSSNLVYNMGGCLAGDTTKTEILTNTPSEMLDQDCSVRCIGENTSDLSEKVTMQYSSGSGIDSSHEERLDEFSMHLGIG